MTETRAASVEAAVGGALLMALALPLSRMGLQASLVGHVLAQMPLLALSGWLVGTAFAPRLNKIVERWNRGGIAGLTLVIFTILYWMLPRSIDRAVQDGGYELIKFMWLPCAGVALAISFERAHPLVAGALKANLMSMLAVLAWLYTATPVRLCNRLSKAQKIFPAKMKRRAASFCWASIRKPPARRLWPICRSSCKALRVIRLRWSASGPSRNATALSTKPPRPTKRR